MKILAGIDEHDEATWVARSALELAARWGADLRFVHVLPGPEPGLLPVANMRELRQQATEIARQRVHDRAAAWCRGTRWEGALDDLVDVRAGSPARELALAADETKATLLVVGPHERSGPFDFGRTVRGLLAHESCSLWIQKAPPTEVARVLAPIDLSPASTGVLGWARDVARAFGAPVHALHRFEGPYFAYGAGIEPMGAVPTHVVDAAREAARDEFGRILDEFDWQGVEHTSLFSEGQPVAGILETCQDGDLLVCGAHGHGWLSTTFLGGHAYHLAKESQVPILVARGAPGAAGS